MPSLELSIHHAGLAIWEDGRSFRHQNLIRRRARPKAKAALSAARAEIAACKSFHSLHSLVRKLLNPIKGLGPLFIYDCATRLGYYLLLAPDYIYLHAGTRDGAKALGLDYRREHLSQQDLPAPLSALTPAQTESFLCIYKDALTTIGKGPASQNPRRPSDPESPRRFAG